MNRVLAGLQVWMKADDEPPDAIGMARVVAHEEDRVVIGTRQLLSTVASLPAHRDYAPSPSSPILRSLSERDSWYWDLGSPVLGKAWERLPRRQATLNGGKWVP